MSSEQALREHFEATNRRDYPAAMAYYDEEVVAVSYGTGVDVGVFRGVELRQQWAWVYWMRSGKIVRVEIHENLEDARAIAGVAAS